MTKIREILQSDLVNVLELNNKNTPAVSDLNLESLNHLYSIAKYRWIIENEDAELIGFCFILGTGADYKSLNYKWAGDHYDNFQYLDRVVISSAFQRQGYGKILYQYWIEKAGPFPLLLEVNIKPRNDSSILFHEEIGFKTVGEQDTEYGKKRVQYMEFTSPLT